MIGVDSLSGVYVNVTNLCGKEGWLAWDSQRSDFGHCFLNLLLILPAQACMGITSAYYLGFQSSRWFLRTTLQKYTLILRSLVTFLLALLPLARSVALYVVDRPSVTAHGEAGILCGAVECFSWSLHLMYTYLLYHRLSLSVRGPTPILISWLACFLVNMIQIRSSLLNHSGYTSNGDKILYGCSVYNAICQTLYLISLLPAGDQRGSQYQELHERQRLLATSGVNSYGGFLEATDPHYLGVAKDRAGLLNRLIFRWIDPLIKKAQNGRLQQADDVFDLPDDLTVHTVAQKVRKEWNQLEKVWPVDENQTPHVGLVKLLYRCFGLNFLSIGVLKFVNDCAGFAGPLLLNLLVTLVEDSSQPISRGYLYAAMMTFTSLVASLCSTHFNFKMAELGIQVRAALTTSVYRKTVSVSKSRLSKFSMGELVNFMSTDTDRVVNFGPSIHAAWSLPFQFGVTLVLLYQQVGVSFLTGLVFTILIIPVNKVLANKIGSLSEKMMTAKDGRVSTMAELLTGIRVIKYFNWQDVFTERVNKWRKMELKYLAGRKYLDAGCVFLWATTPVLISLLTFVTYVLLGNTLTAAKVFTSVALFAMLTGPLNAFPWVLNGLVEALVSIRRLEKFLSVAEFNPDLYFSRDIDQNNDIDLKGASFIHKEGDEMFQLDELTLSVSKGDMVGVMGQVGAGKSSLLEALLGELEKVGGEICVVRPSRGVGYVRQEAWLQLGTVRDNILFGKAYQHSWYNKVTEACAMQQDFHDLSHGDLTRVGEGGVTLSGGQRARVALARAVYQDKEIYLVDDIFSAVDGHVAAHIYRKCFLGLLKEKTRVLCTHHSRYLSMADSVIVLKDGKVLRQGSPSSILPSVTSKDSTASASNFSVVGTPSLETEGRNSPINQLDVVEENQEVEKEEREEGKVKWRVYRSYWRAVGNLLSPTILLSLLVMQVSRNMTDLWLAHWVDDDNMTHPNISQYSQLIQHELHVRYYLIIYGSIAAANTIFTLMRAFLFAFGGITAAKIVHTKLLKSVLRGKIVFFDTTSFGQILNRFSSDLCTVDDNLPFILNIFLANMFGVVGPLCVTVYAMPWLLLLLLPLSLIYLNIQARYRPASRDLKRVGSVSMSPIYSHYSETLAGLTTIRAMRDVTRFVRDNMEKIENSLKVSYSSQAASQWLELRLQLIGCSVVGGVSVIAVIQHHATGGGANPGLVGLAISYALGITGKLSGLVSSFTETERELVAVERCCQYVDNIGPEEVRGSITSPYDWPSEGIVTLKNVYLRYQEHLPFALNDLSFQTKAGEKVGIVGRTGSGKSSLFHVLYRLTEVQSGEVYIDNVNVRLLDLDELREQLVIIPQEPFLFQGTITENLDPVGFCTQRQIKEAVKKCRLEDLVERLGGLNGVLESQGGGMSAGQRQLMCLARAVLSPAKVVLIDEATANVDLETDQHLQEVIQNCLANRTVLTIAHRVDTVLGCDRVLVMESGTIVESGHPNILLQDGQSKFAKFVSNR